MALTEALTSLDSVQIIKKKEIIEMIENHVIKENIQKIEQIKEIIEKLRKSNKNSVMH